MKEKGTQGFAGMDPEKQRELARRGGIEAHRKGTAHEWTREEAAIAGRKGGQRGGVTRARKAREQAELEGEA